MLKYRVFRPRKPNSNPKPKAKYPKPKPLNPKRYKPYCKSPRHLQLRGLQVTGSLELLVVFGAHNTAFFWEVLWYPYPLFGDPIFSGFKHTVSKSVSESTSSYLVQNHDVMKPQNKSCLPPETSHCHRPSTTSTLSMAPKPSSKLRVLESEFGGTI